MIRDRWALKDVTRVLKLRNSRNVVGVITYAVPISAVKNISGLAAPEVGRIRTAAVTISNVNTTPLFSPFWTSVVIRDVTYLGPLVSITFVYVESIPRCRRAHRSNRMRKRMESGDGLLIARSCGADEMISEKKMMMLDEPIFCQRESPPNAISVPRRAESLKRSLRWDQLLLAQSPIDALCIECVLASLLDGVGQLF